MAAKQATRTDCSLQLAVSIDLGAYLASCLFSSKLNRAITPLSSGRRHRTNQFTDQPHISGDLERCNWPISQAHSRTEPAETTRVSVCVRSFATSTHTSVDTCTRQYTKKGLEIARMEIITHTQTLRTRIEFVCRPTAAVYCVVPTPTRVRA